MKKPTKDYWFTEKFVETAIGMFILNRIVENRDVKIVITSHGSTTGTGKTTLAIHLAKEIHKLCDYWYNNLGEWNAKNHSFVTVPEYLEQYKEAQEGRVLISDELETMLDNRRSMSNENVNFTQAWQMLRYKNVLTVGTAPGLHMLDKRVMQTADIWINVLAKGYAIPMHVSTHDFTGDPIYTRFKLHGKPSWIRWDKATGDDYQHLHEKKKEQGIPGTDERVDESDVKNAKKKARNNAAKELIDMKLKKDIDVTQEDIARVSGWSQPKISNMIKDKKRDLGLL